MNVKRLVLAAVFVLAASVLPALAQGPLHKEVRFTISGPFVLRNTHKVLPAGNYILYEISALNPSVFALYRENKMHSPVSMLTTVRIEYSGTEYPDKVRILTDIDERSPQNYTVLEGFNIPGESGWEVISGVTRRGSSSGYVGTVSSSKHHRY
jgi:hypothetical protein